MFLLAVLGHHRYLSLTSLIILYIFYEISRRWLLTSQSITRSSEPKIKYGNSNAWRFVLISGCLIEHFNISGSERVAYSSCIKSAGRTPQRKPWGEVVSEATISVRKLVARSIVGRCRVRYQMLVLD